MRKISSHANVFGRKKAPECSALQTLRGYREHRIFLMI